MEHKKKKKRRKIILNNSFETEHSKQDFKIFFRIVTIFFFKLSNIIRNCIFHFMY